MRPQKGLKEDFLGTRHGCAMVAGIQKVIELMAGLLSQKSICRDPVGRWEDGYISFNFLLGHFFSIYHCVYSSL